MQIMFASPAQWILGFILILSSLGVVLASKPVHSSLSFLLTLLSLAVLYLEQSAEFIAAMQVLVYAGAILVIFIFVMILFQDAHEKINQFKGKSAPFFLCTASILFTLAFVYMGWQLIGLPAAQKTITDEFGTVQSLGYQLYIHFFFPFEAITLLFLIAMIGALYIGRKSKNG